MALPAPCMSLPCCWILLVFRPDLNDSPDVDVVDAARGRGDGVVEGGGGHDGSREEREREGRMTTQSKDDLRILSLIVFEETNCN